MNIKNELTKKITSVVLIIALALSSVIIAPTTVRAAGWLDYVRNLTLGTTVIGSIKSGDYRGPIENDANFGGEYYWHIYRFNMPSNGILNLYIECSSKAFFANLSADGYAIFSGSDLDDIIWSTYQRHNELETSYSSARAMYSKTTDLSLEEGVYYFAIRSSHVSDNPYYLTLSYKEPNINITSISLDKKTLKLEPGEQATVNADALPDNATDKTVVWESSDSSIASVENGIITARSPGAATITAASSDGEISASCAVTVINTPAIDELEESQPTITSIQSGKRKVTVYYEPIYMDDVKYQISYRIGGGKWKIKNVSDSPATIRSLHSKKTYSVRVRGYKNIDGSVYYSGWSKSRRVKIR